MTNRLNFRPNSDANWKPIPYTFFCLLRMSEQNQKFFLDRTRRGDEGFAVPGRNEVRTPVLQRQTAGCVLCDDPLSIDSNGPWINLELNRINSAIYSARLLADFKRKLGSLEHRRTRQFFFF